MKLVILQLVHPRICLLAVQYLVIVKMYFVFFIVTISIFSANAQQVPPANSKCVFPEKLLNECAEVTSGDSASSDQLKKLYPWHVGLYRLKQNAASTVPINVCGGTLISASVMLTAAHCLAEDVDGSLRNISEYFVAAGNDYREFDDERDAAQRQIRQISRVVLPSAYKGHQSGFVGDIAIVELKQAFDLSVSVRPACLAGAASHEKQTQRNGQTVGWGLTVASRHPDTRLTRLDVPYVDLATCRREVNEEFHKYLTDDKFCGEFSNGASICSTDNGGGILYAEADGKGVTRWYLDGVTSVGLISGGSCETKQYSAFTSLQNQMSLICQSVVSNV